MSFPASLVLLGIAVAHIVIDLTADHGPTSHSESPTKMQLAKSKFDGGPKIELVKAHVRSAPDGIEQNNLSYDGIGKISPNGKFVSVKGYVRGDSQLGTAPQVGVNEAFNGHSFSITSSSQGDASVGDLTAAMRLEIARQNGVLSCALHHGHESAIGVLAHDSLWRDLRFSFHLALTQIMSEWMRFFGAMRFNGEAQWRNFKNFWTRVWDDDYEQDSATKRVSAMIWTCVCLSTLDA